MLKILILLFFGYIKITGKFYFLIKFLKDSIDCFQQSPNEAYQGNLVNNIYTCRATSLSCYKYVCVGDGMFIILII